MPLSPTPPPHHHGPPSSVTPGANVSGISSNPAKSHVPVPTPTSSTATRTTVIFWPIQEPLRTLWDDENRVGFGWVYWDYEGDGVGQSASGSTLGSGEEREGGTVDAVPATVPLTHSHSRRNASTNVTARVCIAGVFQPGTSLEEAHSILRRVLEDPSSETGEKMGEDGDGKQETEGKGGGGTGAKPEVIDLRSLGRGNGDASRRPQRQDDGEEIERKWEGKNGPEEGRIGGRRNIQIVLYDRYESGSLRYWEVDGSRSISGLETTPTVDAPADPKPSSARTPTLKQMAHHLNDAPGLADRVAGRRVRMYRPAAAVVLAVFGAVLRPVLGVLANVLFSRAARTMDWTNDVRQRDAKGKDEGKDSKEIVAKGIREGVWEMGRKVVRTLGRKSAVVKQVRVRAHQVEGLVRGVDELTQVRWEGSGGGVEEYVGVYNRFFNALWLILNDLTLGVAVGSFLLDNTAYLASGLDEWLKMSKDALPAALVWLDSWPAGLKLNSDLSRFYVRVLGVCVAEGGPGALLLRVSPPILTPGLLKAAGYISSVLGLSFLLALVIDVGVGLGCGGVTLGYAVARVGYVVVKEALSGLGALFRGKRYNALRHRMDAHDYDIDQLLFGTMLFTLVAFLSPTAVAFYFLFAGARLLTLLAQACLEILLAFINTFPLFLLVLKMKDPKRIPASIIISPLSSTKDLVPLLLSSESEAEEMQRTLGVTGVLKIENQPRGVKWVFGTYRKLGERLMRHYNPGRLVVGLIRGIWLGGLQY